MKKLKIAFLLFAACCGHGLFAQSRAQIEAYIQKFKGIAMAEMSRTGVPAAITLAQGIHETAAGTSDLVVKSNNHFGIKCKTEWEGDRVFHDDDERGECFRKYEDPAISYKDHSDFLRNRPYYASLFKLDPADFEAWAYGLKKAGYATNPKYPQILIKLINDFNLQDYSLIVLGRKEPGANEPAWTKSATPEADEVITARNEDAVATVRPVYPVGIFTINDTKVVAVTRGTSYLKIAEDHHLSLARLFEFNDMEDGDVAKEDGLLFLQRKRRTGANEFHTVTTGETLYQVSQSEGIRLENLLQYNFLTPNAMVATGEKLYLKEKAPARPRLAAEHPANKSLTTGTPKQVNAAASVPAVILHEVQPRETMYSIAKRYEASVDEVKRWNEMDSTGVKIGQKIRIKQTR